MTFLGELQKDIVETEKVLGELTESFYQAAQSSKKWTIVSRFLSGTGLWAIQNKLRGVISVVAEYQNGTQAALETAQKQSELMEKLADRSEKLNEAEKKRIKSLSNSEKGTRNAIKAGETAIKGYDAQIERLEAIQNRTSAETQSLQVLVRARRKANDTLTENKELLEELNPVWEERQKLQDHYNIGAGKANKLLKGRMEIMRDTVTAQDKILKGSEKVRELQGEGELLGIDMHRNLKRQDKARANIKKFKGTNPGLEKIARNQLKALKKQEKSIKHDQRRNWILLKFAKVKEFMGRVAKFAKVGFAVLGKALMWSPLIILGVIAAWKLIKMFWPVLVSIWDVIKKGWEFTGQAYFKWSDLFGDLWRYFGELWGYFKEGDIWGAALTILKIAGQMLLISFQLTFGLLTGILFALAGKTYDWLSKLVESNKSQWKQWAGTAIEYLGAIALVAGGIAFFFGGGWVALLAAGLGVFINMVGKWIKDEIEFFHTGGISKGGLTMVGERGPELLKLPKGSRVFSNKDTRSMVSNSGQPNIHVHVSGRLGASDQEIRDIARKVGAQINREINRTTSSVTRA